MAGCLFTKNECRKCYVVNSKDKMAGSKNFKIKKQNLNMLHGIKVLYNY